MTPVAQKNRRVGMALAGVVVALAVYSLLVIKARGQRVPPALTGLQKVLAGL